MSCRGRATRHAHHPDQDSESKVIAHESGVNTAMAESLARLGEKVRNLKDHGLQEGASTRLLIYAGKLIKHGIPPRRACQSAVVWGVTDDQEVQKSIWGGGVRLRVSGTSFEARRSGERRGRRSRSLQCRKTSG